MYWYVKNFGISYKYFLDLKNIYKIYQKMQKCKNAKMQKCKNAKMQKCKNAKISYVHFVNSIYYFLNSENIPN